MAIYCFFSKETLDAMGEGATAASSVEQGSSVEQNRGLTSGLRQSDITAFPSFQSVLEMGYSESEIREAFNQLKGKKCNQQEDHSLLD